MMPDPSRTVPNAMQDAVIARVESEVAFLRAEPATCTESVRRKDHLLAAALDGIPELPAVSDDPPLRVSNLPREAQGTQRALWRRWWRRVTGGERTWRKDA